MLALGTPARADTPRPPPSSPPSSPPEAPRESEDDDSAAEPSPSPAAAPVPPPAAQKAIHGKKQLLDGADYFTKRYEPAGFPLIGGDSDIGFEFGAVGTLTRFADGTKPYVWNMDLVLAASVKSGPTGAEVAQQHYLWNWDIPGLAGGALRLNPAAAYTRTINDGYFGLGNASGGTIPANVAGTPGRYYEYISTEAKVTQFTRLTLGPNSPLSFVTNAQFRYFDATTYPGSKLAIDAAITNANRTPYIRGVNGMSQTQLSVGFIYDTRDSEIFTRSGQLHEIAIKTAQGLPYGDDVRYAGASATLDFYHPVVGPLVFAARGVADLLWGNVPFYDLYTGGTFQTTEMPGGSAGVRGVPIGRYLGKIKAVGNVELRAMWLKFKLLGQKFTIGDNVFFDAGRVWTDYTFHNPLDGSGLGLKWGTGVGTYVMWGQAAVFRIEAAYSPDARAENPNFPIGLYVEEGTMF
jgi:outer membrane protein assembly factor BamA